MMKWMEELVDVEEVSEGDELHVVFFLLER